VTKTTWDKLTITPIPHPLALLGRRRERNRSVTEPRKKLVGGKCVKIWFYFSLSCSDLIGDELNSLFFPSSVCFVCESNW